MRKTREEHGAREIVVEKIKKRSSCGLDMWNGWQEKD